MTPEQMETAKILLNLLAIILGSAGVSGFISILYLKEDRKKRIAESRKTHADAEEREATAESIRTDISVKLLENLRLEMSNLRSDLDKTRLEVLEVKTENITLSRENQALKVENAQLSNEVAALREDNHALRIRIEQLSRELDELRTRRSGDE